MKTIGELVFERQSAQTRQAAQVEEPAPEAPASVPTDPAKLDAARDECRVRGRQLFAAFDERQRRVLEAEVIMAQGRRNPEERHRLALTVRALREWMCAAKELGLLQEFSKEIRRFARYLQHEAREEALAAKVELPWRTRLFLESGTDVTVPTSRPTRQALDFDLDRVLHPRY